MAFIYRARSGSVASDDAVQPQEVPPISPAGLVLALLGAGGMAASITTMYRGMAVIMETEGGFVAVGGPYEIAHPAPTWAWLLPVAFIGVFIFGGLALWGTTKGWGESPMLYGWMGMFIPFGWNFLRLGFDPPGGGRAWGWIVSGVLFWIMGIVPAGFVVSWAIDAFKNARAHKPQETVAGRPTRGIYLAMHVVGVAAGILGGNLLFAAATGL